MADEVCRLTVRSSQRMRPVCSRGRLSRMVMTPPPVLTTVCTKVCSCSGTKAKAKTKGKHTVRHSHIQVQIYDQVSRSVYPTGPACVHHPLRQTTVPLSRPTANLL